MTARGVLTSGAGSGAFGALKPAPLPKNLAVRRISQHKAAQRSADTTGDLPFAHLARSCHRWFQASGLVINSILLQKMIIVTSPCTPVPVSLRGVAHFTSLLTLHPHTYSFSILHTLLISVSTPSWSFSFPSVNLL